MNKQEAIERIESRAFNIEDTDLVVGLSFTKNIINQINEPQKVVVPRFVKDWLKKYRHAHTLLRVLNAVENEQVIPSTVNDWILDNQYDFIKAWLDGYEIEKEKLYTVEIPNPNGVVICLERLDGGKIALSTLGESELTESEIKEDFEWAWQWAKEVGNDTEV